MLDQEKSDQKKNNSTSTPPIPLNVPKNGFSNLDVIECSTNTLQKKSALSNKNFVALKHHVDDQLITRNSLQKLLVINLQLKKQKSKILNKIRKVETKILIERELISCKKDELRNIKELLELIGSKNSNRKNKPKKTIVNSKINDKKIELQQQNDEPIKIFKNLSTYNNFGKKRTYPYLGENMISNKSKIEKNINPRSQKNNNYKRNKLNSSKKVILTSNNKNILNRQNILSKRKNILKNNSVFYQNDHKKGNCDSIEIQKNGSPRNLNSNNILSSEETNDSLNFNFSFEKKSPNIEKRQMKMGSNSIQEKKKENNNNQQKEKDLVYTKKSNLK
ncbi:hypothetical protein M0813_07070 [Anaeramoeba flamelloides]|uniref:Uncharacterized protein n=1 Tax=Anaeramoeba flamelloides TaxID=1746091 RepID=A0ABQ8XD83_9EUKA|nr:hypothetical protein M0813_07070 [Anaeramoeba flamelloides]